IEKASVVDAHPVPPPPPPVASVPQLNTPFVLLTSQFAEFKDDTVSEVEDAIPTTSSWAVGAVRPTPTLPCESITKAVEVAVSVEGEMRRRSTVALAYPARYIPSVVALPCCTESLAAGEVVPMPTLPLLKIRTVSPPAYSTKVFAVS